MYYKRTIEDRLLEVSGQFPVVLLTGPRQVGKTTLLRHLREPERAYVTLDDPSLRALAQEDPALFLQQYPAPVLIDEIQYAPELLPYLKMEVDRERWPGAFWLTGSQQFQMMQGITESLAGRVAIVHLLGFSNWERDRRDGRLPPFLPLPARVEERLARAGESDLEAVFQRIWTGAYPALVSGQITDRELFYSSYLQTYLQRDVRDLAQVGSQEAFLRFLKACAARTAQILNLSDLARDVDIAPNTAKTWLAILEASLQVLLLRPFHSNVAKRLVKSPKLYFLDTGLASYLSEWSSPRTLAAGAMAGPLLETHALVEILKSYWYRLREPHLYFYRDREGREVDFLFHHDGLLHPVEVKLAATPRRTWARWPSPLAKLGDTLGHGAILCLSPHPVPLDRKTTALPIGLL